MQAKHAVVSIVGSVVGGAEPERGAPGLWIEAWDADGVAHDPFGSGRSDDHGHFEVRFSHNRYREVGASEQADLYFRVFREKRLIASTERSVLWNLKGSWTPVVIDLQENEPGGVHGSTDPEFTTEIIPRTHLRAIRESIRELGGNDTKQLAEFETHLERLLAPATVLDLVLLDAQEFLLGSRLAGHRLLIHLNRVLSDWAGPLVEGPPGVGPDAAGLAGHIAAPDLPRIPCLVRPKAIGRIHLAIEWLVQAFPKAPDTVGLYHRAVDDLVDRLGPLHALHVAERFDREDVFSGGGYFRQVFESTRATPAGTLLPGQLSTAGKVPARFRAPYPLVDVCRLEQWDYTERGSRCFRALAKAPHYGIDDIFNVSKGVSRRGCQGDEIEIRGRNLGSRGRVRFGRAEAAVSSWSERVIRFRIPERAAGELAICIDPDITACVEFPFACRRSDAGTNHAFELVQPIMLNVFELRGWAVEPRGDGRFRMEACSAGVVHVNIVHAERLIIRDASGRVVWEAGDGTPGRFAIDAVRVEELREHVTYDLEASNLCGSVERRIAVEVFFSLRIDGPRIVRAGETAEYRVFSSCPAARDIPITIVSSPPGSLIGPVDRVAIPEGSSSIALPMTGHPPCAETTVTAEAFGHEPGSRSVRIVDAPVVTSTSPTTLVACHTQSLSIQGDCFDPEGINGVTLQPVSGRFGIYRTGRVRRFLDAGNPLHQSVLEIEVDGLLPGAYRLQVEAHDLQGPWFEGLSVRPLAAEITHFEANPRTVFPCFPTRVTIDWAVRYARRVELRVAGRVEASEEFEAFCLPSSGRRVVTLDKATDVELLAYPSGGGSPTRSSISLPEVSVEQASRVTLRNSTESPRFPYSHRLTIWEVNWTTGDEPKRRGLLEPNEQLDIALEDCNAYSIFATSHEWVTLHNERHRTRLDPDNPDVILWPEVHKFTLNVLGRNSAALRFYDIGPGEGINIYGRPWPSS